MESSKWLCLDKATQYNASTINTEHNLYETTFQNAIEPILKEQRGELRTIGMSENIPSKTKPVGNEVKAIQNIPNISEALKTSKEQLSITEFDKQMQSIFDNRDFLEHYITGAQQIASVAKFYEDKIKTMMLL